MRPVAHERFAVVLQATLPMIDTRLKGLVLLLNQDQFEYASVRGSRIIDNIRYRSTCCNCRHQTSSSPECDNTYPRIEAFERDLY